MGDTSPRSIGPSAFDGAFRALDLAKLDGDDVLAAPGAIQLNVGFRSNADVWEIGRGRYVLTHAPQQMPFTDCGILTSVSFRSPSGAKSTADRIGGP
jgi:hypothetical protein